LGLREPGACGLSPAVIKVKEHVVQVLVLVADRFNLVEVRRNIRNLVKVLWTDLANVQINYMAIVGIDFVELFRVQRVSVNPVLNMNMLMWQNH
jgi:hypothetical protein